MNHLTVDEIIEFVSSCEMNDESIEFIASVNEHIRKCSECFKLVRAFQMIYDEFESMCLNKDFISYLYENVDFNELNFREDEEENSLGAHI